MAPQREWFEKDYYRVLGVSESASAKEITSAYRKLSRQYHPDANPGDAAAEERFKEVSAAYDVVGDEEQAQGVRRGPPARARPAAGVRPGRRRRSRAGSRFQDVGDLGDLLGGLFGRGAARRRPRPRRRAARTAAHDLETELHLAFDDAVHGRHHHGAPHQRRAVLHLPRLRRQARHHARTRARSCGGRGVRRRQPGPVLVPPPCPACARPRRHRSTTRAPPAGAPGVERRPREVKVRIPAGVADGQRIRLKGRGGPGRNGGPPGDLYVDRARGAAPAVRPQGQRPHPHRAGHLPRGRARRRRRGAHARRRPGHAARSRPAPGRAARSG